MTNKRNFYDFSNFTDPIEALEAFHNAIRVGMDFNALPGPVFLAKVLNTPIPLDASQISAVMGRGVAAGRCTNVDDKKMVTMIFKGRIEPLHAFLDDPCELAYAENPTRVRCTEADHTEFIATIKAGEIPSAGDIVEVQLAPGSNGAWDLQYGRCLGIYQANGGLTPPSSSKCRNGRLAFNLNEASALTLGDFECGDTGPPCAVDSTDLNTLEPSFKGMVETLISALETRGFETTVFTAFRSVESQIDKQRQGLSDVKYSYHNFVNSQGRPAAQAVDLALTGVGWGPEDGAGADHELAAQYFKALGEEANKLGLEWGGDWSKRDPIWAAHGMGWDPAHVELTKSPGQTMAQAQASAQTAGYSVG